jgi:hypothetical protein
MPSPPCYRWRLLVHDRGTEESKTYFSAREAFEDLDRVKRLWPGATKETLIRSVDGGATWSEVT